MVEPYGCLSLAQEHLRQMLAATAEFQKLMHAGNPGQALERIYHEGLPKPAQGDTHTLEELRAYRPYAVMYMAEEDGFRRTLEAMGDAQEYDEGGRLILRLERESPDNHNDEPTAPSNLGWKNIVGQIIDELCELAGTAGYLAFQSIGVLEGPYWSHPKVAETEGIAQGVKILVQW